jgi:pimeloyl-ACP methyl ester carboxylesterase
MTYPDQSGRQFFAWRGKQIAYYTAGRSDAPPLLLVHSINAAASSFEFRQTFAGLSEQYRVTTFDLLGFGGSDRPAQRYSASEYADLIADLQRAVVGAGAGVIASSLGAAYTVRAAAHNPGLFGPLLLICPTGIRDLAQPAQPGLLYALLYGPLGDVLFAGLASRPSIRYFLAQQSYYDPAVVTEALIDGFYRAAQQPNAKYAPICFLTGLLNCHIAEDFATLPQPIQLVWGRQAEITPFSRAGEFLALNRQAQIEVIEHARLSVQDEQPQLFNQLAGQFFSRSLATL